MNQKVYLGDGAYVALEDDGLVLTAENGIEATDRVVLGSFELEVFLNWLRDRGIIKAWSPRRPI